MVPYPSDCQLTVREVTAERIYELVRSTKWVKYLSFITTNV